MSIKDIKQAIIQLPESELTELVSWLHDYHHQIWDKQMEEDLDCGRLDSLIAGMEKEYQTAVSRIGNLNPGSISVMDDFDEPLL